MPQVAEKQYVSTHVLGKRITDFQVKSGRAIIQLEGGGVLEIGARANSVTLCYQGGNGTLIQE